MGCKRGVRACEHHNYCIHTHTAAEESSSSDERAQHDGNNYTPTRVLWQDASSCDCAAACVENAHNYLCWQVYVRRMPSALIFYVRALRARPARPFQSVNDDDAATMLAWLISQAPRFNSTSRLGATEERTKMHTNVCVCVCVRGAHMSFMREYSENAPNGRRRLHNMCECTPVVSRHAHKK